MTKPIVLDSGPLGRISHPRAETKNKEIVNWLKDCINKGAIVCIPEIADYEVRRELLRANKPKGIERLNQLKSLLRYLPLDTETMLKAAEFWAEARNRGKPTADSKELDGDVILAAQAVRAGAVIATGNVGHLSQFVSAKKWKDIA